MSFFATPEPRLPIKVAADARTSSSSSTIRIVSAPCGRISIVLQESAVARVHTPCLRAVTRAADGRQRLYDRPMATAPAALLLCPLWEQKRAGRLHRERVDLTENSLRRGRHVAGDGQTDKKPLRRDR